MVRSVSVEKERRGDEILGIAGRKPSRGRGTMKEKSDGKREENAGKRGKEIAERNHGTKNDDKNGGPSDSTQGADKKSSPNTERRKEELGSENEIEGQYSKKREEKVVKTRFYRAERTSRFHDDITRLHQAIKETEEKSAGTFDTMAEKCSGPQQRQEQNGGSKRPSDETVEEEQKNTPSK